MRIIFMGTPEFALPGLEELAERGITISAVITRPDQPAGRGRKTRPSPIKKMAMNRGLNVLQPEKLNDPALVASITALDPDLIVVSAYGKYIPASFLDRARHRGINLHPSLLPRYRGAAPIQWTLINGDREAGVSVISVSEQMDAGDIYAQKSIPVRPDDNAETLSRKLSREGGGLLADVVEMIARGTASPHPQKQEEVTFAPRLTKADGWIDWEEPAGRINNRVRGLYPWPGTFTTLETPQGSVKLKIIQCVPLPGAEGSPGEVLEAKGTTLTIAAGEGKLAVLRLQLEGRRPLATAEFLRGHPIPPGTILGKTP